MISNYYHCHLVIWKTEIQTIDESPMNCNDVISPVLPWKKMGDQICQFHALLRLTTAGLHVMRFIDDDNATLQGPTFTVVGAALWHRGVQDVVLRAENNVLGEDHVRCVYGQFIARLGPFLGVVWAEVERSDCISSQNMSCVVWTTCNLILSRKQSRFQSDQLFCFWFSWKDQKLVLLILLQTSTKKHSNSSSVGLNQICQIMKLSRCSSPAVWLSTFLREDWTGRFPPIFQNLQE